MSVSVQAQRKNELFSELAENIKYELIKAGIVESEAGDKAEEIAFNIYENWRGLSIVFPMNPQRYMEKLKAKILNEFDGRNTTEIVRKYKISEYILYSWNRGYLRNKKDTEKNTIKKLKELAKDGE